ncbi:MAG: hypothetical protein IJU66_01435 [Oscillospiraceae bacterium]|nr:hypothetical protein [Oscillospiraceae bacterium]
MGIFDALKKQDSTQKGSGETFTFAALPCSLAELRALPEASLDSPYKTAALTLAALCAYEKDESAVHEMLNYLKGPEELSTLEKQFLRDRLAGKGYKCLSFFAGATPQNGYAPETPYRITVSATPYSFDNENWATLYVTSGGADSPRPIKLRKKPSTGQWFLNEIQCLSDIRVPAAQDPWA